MDAALDAVGFPYGRDRRTTHLSGGEQQRLAIAGMLALRPGLILLDEPTANLDLEGSALVVDLLRRIVERNAPTMLVVEHRLEEILPLVTRVVALSRETRTINAVTATRGNIDRIPRTAVTVGMKEILQARKIRLYLNRPWQCAIVRKLLHGPITAAVPASLVRHHPDVQVTMTREVTQLPEPVLR